METLVTRLISVWFWCSFGVGFAFRVWVLIHPNGQELTIASCSHSTQYGVCTYYSLVDERGEGVACYRVDYPYGVLCSDHDQGGGGKCDSIYLCIGLTNHKSTA